MSVIPFRIVIGPRSDDGGFPVRASVADTTVEASLDLPEHLVTVGERLLAPNTLMRLDHPEVIGRQLGRALFTPRLRGLLLEQARGAAQGGGRLQIQLQIGVPELAALPWEWLTIGGSRPWTPALRDDYTLVRVGRQARPSAPIVVDGPLRVLAIAGSGQRDQLELLAEALDPLIRDRQIAFDPLPDASLRTIQQALTTRQYHILHVAGAVVLTPEQELIITLKSDVNGFDLADLLADYPTLRLVTLTGGQGDSLHISAAPALLGAILTTEQIPAALAFSWMLPPESSAQASAVLYDALSDGSPLDLAVAISRRTLREADEPAWGALQVRTLPGADQLFVMRPAPGAMSQTSLRRLLPPAIAIVAIIALILLGVMLFNQPSPPSRAPATATATAESFPFSLLPQGPTITPIDGRPIPTALPDAQSYVIHTLALSDTLDSLAERYGSDTRGIAELNTLDLQAPLRAGRGIVVPVYRAGATQGGGLLVDRASPDKPLVALTFDIEVDQESVYSILETLRSRKLHATFFVTGSWVTAFPEAARAIVRDGHEIANHTYNHPYLSRIGYDGAAQELEQTERTVREITGATTRPYFRFPYGDSTDDLVALVGQHGYIAYHWSADDAAIESWLMHTEANPASGNGAILLMHGRAGTASTLPGWLDRIAATGLRVTTLGEALR